MDTADVQFTLENYLMLAKQLHLSFGELEFFSIGGLIDYANTYADGMNRTKRSRARKATQADIDKL